MKVVTLGGGTGMPIVLEACSELPVDVTAISAVTDNGRPSGKIRENYGIPATGDIRRAVTSLCPDDKVAAAYEPRLPDGMSVGNVVIAREAVRVGFLEAIENFRYMLNAQGRVLPASDEVCDIVAYFTDRTICCGESEIRNQDAFIDTIFFRPESPSVPAQTIQSIKDADFLVIGPGSLFTSVLAVLAIPDITRAINDSQGKVIYICNLATQPGQTDYYTVDDHCDEIEDYVGIDEVIVNTGIPEQEVLDRYISEGCEPVEVDFHEDHYTYADLIDNNFYSEWNKKPLMRHSTYKLKKVLKEMVI